MSYFDIQSVQELDDLGIDKWKNMKTIDKNIDKIRADIRKSTEHSRLFDQEKVASLVLGLIDEASFRIGSPRSGSDDTFGVSSVLREHIRFDDGKAIFEYNGKKGLPQVKVIDNPYYVTLLKSMVKYSANNNCDQLFCFQSEKGEIKPLTNRHANSRLNEISGTNNVHVFRHRKVNDMVIQEVLNSKIKTYNQVLDFIVAELGHYRYNKITEQYDLEKKGSTAEKNYIHPSLQYLKTRTGSIIKYGHIQAVEGKKMSRKEIIDDIRNGKLNESSRDIFFGNNE